MKIAMLGHKKLPSHEGGVETVVTELAPRMVKSGMRVDAYNRYTMGELRREKKLAEYEGVRLHRVLTSARSSLNAFVYSVFAVTMAAFHRYDVLHLHAEGICAMIWLPKLLGIPTVVTIHGLDWERAKWGNFAGYYLRFAERMAARHADKVIVLSRNVQEYFQKTYGRETLFINNGVAFNEPQEPELIREFGLEKKRYLLYVGRIVPEKGIHYLLDAYKNISTDMPLVIAGNMYGVAQYVSLIRAKAAEDERVKLIGFAQGQLLAELYSNCAVYILPSELEGMAMTLLEALSYGAPCVLSDIPENREVAGDYAHYFCSGDSADLRRALETLLFKTSPDEIEKTSRQEVAYMRERFSWDHVAERTLDCYKEAIRMHRKGK